MSNEQYKVIAGIDTHADTHHVALVTDYGKRLGDRKFLAMGSGYQEIAAYLTSFGAVTAVSVEGTGSYGAELARVLAGQGLTVREVKRPNRAERRLRGKSDPLDAYQAAESVLADRGTSKPKTRERYVEALRVLRTARTSALKARTALLNQISGVPTSAADEVRAKYRGMPSGARAKALAASRPSGDPADPVVATLLTLTRLGTRHRFLSEEIIDTDEELAQIVSTSAPELLDANGVGTVVASQLLVTLGDNPERMASEAAFAALAGVAPVPVSSGKTNRHRLSRGGDRKANGSLYRIVLVRMTNDPRTREYTAKRTKDGLSKKEIIRCLKRYVAREIFRVMKNLRPVSVTNDLRPLRLAHGLTQVVAASALGCWTTAISRIERGLYRDREAVERYRTWLEKQAITSS